MENVKETSAAKRSVEMGFIQGSDLLELRFGKILSTHTQLTKKQTNRYILLSSQSHDEPNCQKFRYSSCPKVHISKSLSFKGRAAEGFFGDLAGGLTEKAFSSVRNSQSCILCAMGWLRLVGSLKL